MAELLEASVPEADQMLSKLHDYKLLTRRTDKIVEKHILNTGDQLPRQLGSTAWLLTSRYERHDLLQSYAHELAWNGDHSNASLQALHRASLLFYSYINHAFDRQNQDNFMVDWEDRDRFRASEPIGAIAVDAAGRPSDWFERERTNFVALVTATAPNSHLDDAVRLACSAFYFLESGKHFNEWDMVEDWVKGAVESAHCSVLEKARWYRNRARRTFVDVLELHDKLRVENLELENSQKTCREARQFLEKSVSLYRIARECATGAEFVTSLTGEAVAQRELADVRRLEISPDFPPPESIDKAVAAYEKAQTMVEAAPDSIPTQSRENFLASLRLALGITLIMAGSYDNSALDKAEAVIRLSLAYAQQTNSFGRPRHARLKGFALRRLGDVCMAHPDVHAVNAAEFYHSSASVFENEIPDPISRGRAMALEGRALKLAGVRRGDADQLLDQAFRLLRKSNAEDEALVARQWLSE
jgi:hypothetical protein